MVRSDDPRDNGNSAR